MAERTIPLRLSDFSGPAPNVEKCRCWLCANEKAALAAESMKLRAALEELLWYTNQLELAVYDPAEWPSTHGAVRAARAALEGRT